VHFPQEIYPLNYKFSCLSLLGLQQVERIVWCAVFELGAYISSLD